MKKMQVVFLVIQDVHLLDMSGPAHIFYEAAEVKSQLTLKFISPGNQTELKSSSGLYLSQLTRYSDISLNKSDLLFIPGLEANLLLNTDFHNTLQSFYEWMQNQYEKGATICSVCTGAFLLAESGLLDNKECTTHWKYLNEFRKRYPTVTLHDKRLFVENDGLYTSAGVSSGIDLALHLIEKEFGSYFASQIAREVVIYHRRGEADPQLNVFLQYRNHQENRIHEVQNWLTQHLKVAGNIEEIAEQVNMSGRNLTRLFKKTTGITIGQYIKKLRFETASKLLEEGATMEHTAMECGLKSTNQLRNILKKLS